MTWTLRMIAAASAWSLAAPAGAQQPPAPSAMRSSAVCYPKAALQRPSSLGESLWRGVVHDGSAVYELMDTPNGWLLILRTADQVCIVAAGDQSTEIPGAGN